LRRIFATSRPLPLPATRAMDSVAPSGAAPSDAAADDTSTSLRETFEGILPAVLQVLEDIKSKPDDVTTSVQDLNTKVEKCRQAAAKLSDDKPEDELRSQLATLKDVLAARTDLHDSCKSLSAWTEQPAATQ